MLLPEMLIHSSLKVKLWLHKNIFFFKKNQKSLGAPLPWRTVLKHSTLLILERGKAKKTSIMI